MIKSELTSAFFKDYLSYNATTGKFFWLSRHDGKFKCWVDARRWNGHYAGKEAGSKSGPAKGYVAIKIALVGDMFFAHRIAALHLNLIQTYGDKRQIDHIDGNPLNNKAENLRACTRSINGRNRKRHCDNTSGISGVRFLKNAENLLLQADLKTKVFTLDVLTQFLKPPASAGPGSKRTNILNVTFKL